MGQVMKPKGYDLLLLISQIRQESGFDPEIVNPDSGASGLMQLMQDTFNEHKVTLRLKNANIFKPIHNILAGLMEMNRCLDMFGDLRLALTAYNWGNGNLSELIRQAGTTNWDVLKTFVGKKKNRRTGQIEDWRMPKEAREYADKIFAHYNDPETLERVDDFIKLLS